MKFAIFNLCPSVLIAHLHRACSFLQGCKVFHCYVRICPVGLFDFWPVWCFLVGWLRVLISDIKRYLFIDFNQYPVSLPAFRPNFQINVLKFISCVHSHLLLLFVNMDSAQLIKGRHIVLCVRPSVLEPSSIKWNCTMSQEW